MSTLSSHSFTRSRDSTGMVLIWTGVLWKSLKTKTKSKFSNPNCTVHRCQQHFRKIIVTACTWILSKCATSISSRVMTINGGSVNRTKASVMGAINALLRFGTPWKATSRKGTLTPILCSRVRQEKWEQQQQRRSKEGGGGAEENRALISDFAVLAGSASILGDCSTMLSGHW